MRSHVGVIKRDVAIEQATHEHKASARTVVFVLQIDVRWARLQAESAMNARIKTGRRVGKRSVG